MNPVNLSWQRNGKRVLFHRRPELPQVSDCVALLAAKQRTSLRIDRCARSLALASCARQTTCAWLPRFLKVPLNSLGFVRIPLDSFGSSRFLENLGFLGFARIPQEFNDSLGFARIPRIRQDSLGLLGFARIF